VHTVDPGRPPCGQVRRQHRRNCEPDGSCAERNRVQRFDPDRRADIALVNPIAANSPVAMTQSRAETTREGNRALEAYVIDD
jgi:hypothetical protein